MRLLRELAYLAHWGLHTVTARRGGPHQSAASVAHVNRGTRARVDSASGRQHVSVGGLVVTSKDSGSLRFCHMSCVLHFAWGKTSTKHFLKNRVDAVVIHEFTIFGEAPLANWRPAGGIA